MKVDQETEENDNSTSSVDKDSLTGNPNKGQGKKKEISCVNREIFKQK